MTETPILRFAPSPNGRLHLGHAFSALFTARAANLIGGAFLLRIEDIDPQRCRPEFELGIKEDLSWLGLNWPEPVMRQSTRMALYRSAAGTLKERDLLYPCFCSRREVAAATTAIDPDGAPLYPGTCRRLSKVEIAERLARNERTQWRLKMDRAVAESGPVAISESSSRDRNACWAEAIHRQADPGRWGDAVLVRKDAPTSYHLSVVIDDAAQNVTHVTRGMDLFAATDLHVLLQRLLGLPSPLYCHHRLLLDSEAQKLAKSKSSPSLKNMRDSGLAATHVLRELGFE